MVPGNVLADRILADILEDDRQIVLVNAVLVNKFAQEQVEDPNVGGAAQ